MDHKERMSCDRCGVILKAARIFFWKGRPICSDCIALQTNELCNEKDVKIEELRSSFVHCQKNLEKRNVELQDLKSSLTFLRLGDVGDHPDDMQHSDVIILVQGKTDERLRAHKCILSRKSNVFSTMFNINMKEEKTGIISIDDFTLPVIRAMVNFCYNAEVTFTDEVTVEEVLKAAHKYQISLLQATCEKHLIKTLTKGNLPERLRLSERFEFKSLAAAAKNLLKAHFDEVFDDVMKELC